MELQLDTHPSTYRVSSFEDCAIVIGEERYTTSLIVTPKKVVRNWPPERPDEISIDDIGIILALGPELILIGTGNGLHFPTPEILKGVILAGIGIDFMDSRAACRTYNLLAAEGRLVAAGVIIERSTRENFLSRSR